MAEVNTSYKNADVYGRTAFEQMDTYVQSVLLAGSEPAVEPARSKLLGDSLTLAQFTVVGIAAGKIVPATSGGVLPIGILAHGAVSLAANTTVFGQVWTSGCFAIDSGLLVWDASFDTDAKKFTAFEGSPYAATLLLKKRGL
jgi:hypothetical protein